ncbi:MAG: hypothetical protein ACF8PN_07685 [Phycisphaerales bacterium]
MPRTLTNTAIGLLIGGLAGATVYAQPIRYTLTPLGDLAGGEFKSIATGLNESGEVVGAGTSDTDRIATIWTKATGMQVLTNELVGFFSSRAESINNAGISVGEYTVDPGGFENGRAWVWDGVNLRTPLNDNPDISYSRFQNINENNIVAGWAGTQPSNFTEIGIVYDYDNDTITQLNGPGIGPRTTVKRVTLSGLAGGTWTRVDGTATFTSIWDLNDPDPNATRFDLPTLPGFAHHARMTINDAGSVIGNASNDRQFGDRTPWLWNQGDPDLTPLGLFPGFASTSGATLNDDGSILVGNAYDAKLGDGVGVLMFENTDWIDVNELIDESGAAYIVTRLREINDDNWLVGDAINQRSGEMEGVLLRPCEFTATIEGSCPGRIECNVTCGTPGGQFVWLFSENTGNFVVPGGPCAGTQLGLDENARIVRRADLDRNGEGGGVVVLNDNFCGGFLQAVDIESCAVSEVIQIR